ncbi:MAG: O-antigen ligase family protein [Alphaproteobacteria bacterium]
MKLSNLNQNKIYAAFAIVFAVSLQIHMTIFKTQSYDGLRLALSDVFLPLAALFIVISLLSKHSILPQWQKPFGWWALALLTGAVAFSFFWGWHLQGALNPWMFVNKFIGWFILMGHFGISSWMATNNSESIYVFIRAFCFASLAIIALEIANQLMKAYEIPLSWTEDYEAMAGFMVNRNSYAFLLLNSAVFLTVLGFREKIPRSALYFFWIAFPILLIFNGSRTLILCMPVLLLFFMIFDWTKTLRIIVPCVVIGAGLFLLAFSSHQKSYFMSVPSTAFSNLYEYSKQPDNPEVLKKMKLTGNEHRLLIAGESFKLIQKNPLMGSGLGGAVEAQKKVFGKTIDILDNTPLWILTDMGMLGLVAFLTCYLAMGHTFLLQIKSRDKIKSLLAVCTLGLLINFAFFSLFHEILYTRFLWFILALPLVEWTRK